MKTKLLLLAMHLLVFSNFTSAQGNADDDAANIIFSPQESINSGGVTKFITNGVYSINGEIIPCNATSTTLSVTGSCSYKWYGDSLQTNVIGTNSALVVSSITNDTTVYFANMVPSSIVGLQMPPQLSPYSGPPVRGYWFQAPSDMHLRKVYVPTNASSGNQSVAIVRFNAGAPPEYSATTDDFATLGLWQNVSTDTIVTCIYIQAGDFIGVLGSRAGVCSYGTGPTTTVIHGATVNITRLGMQFPLATTAPQQLWQEPGGNISRVELFFASSMVAEAVVPVQITVPRPYELTTTINYCEGDSVLVGGTYYTNTTLSDSLLTVAGCDSVLTTIISPVAIDVTISQSGIELTSNEVGADYQWVDCETDTPILGQTGISFTPSVNGNYAVIVTANGCSYTSNCIVINTVGLDNLSDEIGLNVFPNPAQSELTFTFKGEESLSYQLLDLNGKLLLNGKIIATQGKIDISRLAVGTYLLEVSNKNHKKTIRLIKD
jgi:hypothetical protein